MADASVYILEHVDFSDVKGDNPEVRNCHINIGTGKEITIAALAHRIRRLSVMDERFGSMPINRTGLCVN